MKVVSLRRITNCHIKKHNQKVSLQDLNYYQILQRKHTVMHWPHAYESLGVTPCTVNQCRSSRCSQRLRNAGCQSPALARRPGRRMPHPPYCVPRLLQMAQLPCENGGRTEDTSQQSLAQKPRDARALCVAIPGTCDILAELIISQQRLVHIPP